MSEAASRHLRHHPRHPPRPARPRLQETDLDDLVRRLAARETRAVARAVTVVESGGDPQQGLVGRLAGRTGRARVVGITGPPGAGKSTLVDRLARHCRARGETVGILAVDPTSPFSGGALLGDRIRMQSLYLDPQVFIRSMATRGAMGGLAKATHDAIDVLDAAGFDWVLVETVGVGQDEVDVVRSVDTVVVVTVPGLGDDIQAIKAGILEIADVFVINKADREGADRTARDLETMLGLGERALDWKPSIVKTVAARDEGIDEVLAKVEAHRGWAETSGALARRRQARLRLRVEAILRERVLAEADRRLGLAAEIARGFAEHVDPYRIADRLFAGVVDPHAADAAGAPGAPGARPAHGRNLDHVGIAVASIAEARRFYEALGLAVEAVEEVPQEGVRVAMIPVGETRIELLEPTSPESTVGRFLERRGPGVHHLCFASADVAADDARLRAAGVEVLRPAPTRGAGGHRVQFVHPRSAGGVLVELSQSDPEAGGRDSE